MQGMLSGIERTIPKKGWMKDYEFILVQSIEELEEIIGRAILEGFCAFDLESTGLDTRIFSGVCNTQVVGYSIAFEPKKCYYIPIRHKIETSRGLNLNIQKTNSLIQKLINECEIVGHNWLKFDIEMLFASEGMSLREIAPGVKYPYHDTYVLARLAGMNPAGLKHLSKRLLDKEMIAITEIVTSKKEVDFGSVSPYEGCLYAACDAICTWELFFHPEIQKPIKEQAFIYTIERKLLPVVRRMERNKVKLNVEHCKMLDKGLIDKIEEIELDIYKMVSEKTEGKITSFKIDSPADVSNILFNVYDMDPKPEQGKNGNYKTDDATLQALAGEYPLASRLQEYRTSTKFHRTYIKNMLINVDKTGYLKFNFSALRTDSGRFASPGKSNAGVTKDGCSGVNVQAIPARYDKSKPNVRKCISCEDDEVIVAMDWAGVEIRCAANMSLEPIWLDRFLKGDGDLHTSTAAIIHDIPEKAVLKAQRQIGKCVHSSSLLHINGTYQRIGSIYEGRDKDTFYDLSDDLNVMVASDRTEKIKQFYSNGEADTLLVCTRRGLVACSKNHRFELADGSLVRAEDLTKGMSLAEAIPSLESRENIDKINFNPFLKSTLVNDTFQINLNSDICYFAGLFLGDGSTSSNGSYLTSGDYGKYLPWQESVKGSLNKIGLDCSVSQEDYTVRGETRSAVNLYIGSRHTNSVLNTLELVTNSKKQMLVPSYILNGSKEMQMSFLAGLLDADGTVSKKGFLSLTQKNWELIQDVCVLLSSLGMHFSVDPTFNKDYDQYYFRIHIAKAHNLEFKKYMKCAWKLDRLIKAKFTYSSYPENQVREVISLGEHHLVDIGVDSEEHMYLVNNHRTHNTFNFQSIYGGGPGALASTLGLTIDDAKEKQMRFFGRLVTLNKWIKGLQQTGRKKGYCLTQFGRKRMLPEFESEIPRIQSNAKRKAVNTPVQGSAADLMKIAMILIDKYLEEHKLRDHIQMLLTMHDELVFRIKKTHVDLIPEIEKVMRLDDTLRKIKWTVPLAVDVELGPSWDIHFEYPHMVEYLKAKFNQDKCAFIYSAGQNYQDHLDGCKNFQKEKKEAKFKKEEDAINNPEDRATLQKEDFKKEALAAVSTPPVVEKKIEIPEPKKIEEPKIEAPKIETKIEVPKVETKLEVQKIEKSSLSIDESPLAEENIESLEENTATANDLDKYFSVIQSASLGDLPEEAHQKLKRYFYEQEVERILSGTASLEDSGIRMPIVVHDPIDSSKKNLIGYIIDSCPGNGLVKFLTEKKEDLHQDWVEVDVLKVAVMSKVFNL